MQRLAGNAWRGLLVMAVLIALVGAWALAVGAAEDPSVPLGLTGQTATEIRTASPGGYLFADVEVRSGGLDLVVIGILLAVIAAIPFRQDRRWAWWAMWLLPIWAVSAIVVFIAAGVAPGQAPPTPVYSGLIVGLLSVALLIISAPRFFGRQT